MGIDVRVQAGIASGKDFRVEFSLNDPTQPARAKITLLVNGEGRDFGMRRGAHELPPGASQQILIAGDALWTITGWGTADKNAQITLSAEEEDGEKRSGADTVTVVT